MPSDHAPACPPEPWRSFLGDLDARLTGQVELRCLGGFVVAQHFGIGRETSDIDFVAAIIESGSDDLTRLAGLGSALHGQYRVYLQYVGIATPPAGYASRLQPMFPDAGWSRLSLRALDATDLVLAKLERNADRDREDFLKLVHAGAVDSTAFRQRYAEEVRPYLLGNISWHDQTVEPWLRML